MSYFGRYITKHGAEMLPKYKYAGADDSLVLKYITNPIYNAMAAQVPNWVAPNVITLMGLSFTLISHVLILYFSPDLETRLPDWLYVYQAFAVLAYQAWDAIDGKQARATGTSSPLGLLFDHGCDAINTTIIIVSQMAVLQLGVSWYGLAMWFISGAVFFAGTWEEYYTGVLYLAIANAPNEGVHLMAIISILTGFVLPVDFWKTPLDTEYGPIVPNQAFVVLMIAIGIVTMLGNLFNVAKKINAGAKQDGLLYTYAVALTRGIPPLLAFAQFVYWAVNSPSQVYQRLPIACLWILGLQLAKSVIGIMLAHLCNEKYRPLNRTIVAVLALLTSHNLRLFAHREQVTSDDEDLLVMQLLVVLSCSMVHLIVSVIDEVTTILNIKCFTIPYKKDKKA